MFSIPKRLRIYFLFDRSLLTQLSRSAWKVLNLYLTQAVPYIDAKSGAVVAVQTFGDFQNFHPHMHVLATDGCFYNQGAFMARPPKVPPISHLNLHMTILILSSSPRRRLYEPEAAQRLLATIIEKSFETYRKSTFKFGKNLVFSLDI